MHTGIGRLALLTVTCMVLAGCAGEIESPQDDLPSQPQTRLEPPQECVPFARDHSSVKLYGDAWTWWDKAAGRYERRPIPQEGSVMLLTGYAGPRRGHVAVVREVVSERQILIDHANWFEDGQVYLSDPVEDVSPENDWTQVRVWNMKSAAWGSRVYAVAGFIGPGPETDAPGSDAIASLLSSGDDTVR